ncbi:MAG: 30S ribosomal protein S20, partial [Candidatus Zixiibacteriota bacterium]
RTLKSQLRVAIKELRNETNREEAIKKYQVTTSLLDKAASHGIIHKKNADRNKSRLAQYVHKLGMGGQVS